MLLIKCEISLDLTSSEKYVISSAVGITKFKITNTKFYVSVVNLSTEDNVKLLKQLESGFKKINITLKFKRFSQNRYLIYLIDPCFQGVNRFFVLTFEYETDPEALIKYHLRTVEIKNYNVIINGRNFFDQPTKNDFKIDDNIRKIKTGQWDDYTTGCLVANKYFKVH